MSGIPTSGESEEGSTKPDAKRRDRFDKMKDDLVEQFAGIGVMAYMANQADGQVLLEHADPLAGKLTAVAKQNPAVYKAIKKYLEGSVYTVLALEVAAIGQAILKNHGIDPVQALMNRRKEQAEETSANGRVPVFHHAIPA